MCLHEEEDEEEDNSLAQWPCTVTSDGARLLCSTESSHLSDASNVEQLQLAAASSTDRWLIPTTDQVQSRAGNY